LGVVCTKVTVQGKGGDESDERDSVHDEKQRTENEGLGERQVGGGIEGQGSIITSDTKGAR